MCRESNIVLLTLPPHTDRSVYGPLKRYLNAAMDDWQRTHPSRAITIYEMAELSGVAFNRSMTHTNITAGFEATGIYPLNANIFSESNFLPADVTERPVQQADHPAVSCPIPSTSTAADPIPSTSTAADPIPSKSTAADPIPSKSTAAGLMAPKTTSYVVGIPKASAQQLHTTPEQILPFPKAAPRQKTTKRRKVASAILTTTQEKNKLIKAIAAQGANKPKACKIKKVAVPISSSDDDDEESGEDPFDVAQVEDADIAVGSYVVVKYVAERTSTLHYAGCIIISTLKIIR